MRIRPIRNEEDYKQALEDMESVFDAPLGTADSDKADILALLIEDYEYQHHPIEAPDPIEAIKIRMEELQLRQVDLSEELGGENRVSEVLSRKRRLTVDMIRKLAARLDLSASLLIGEYEISK